MPAGQVEVPARQVNFRGSLPHLASNVLEPMLHPSASHIFWECPVFKQRTEIYNLQNVYPVPMMYVSLICFSCVF